MDTFERLGNLGSIRTYLESRGVEILGNLAAAIAIVVIGNIAARAGARAAGRFLERSGTDTTLVRFLVNLVRGVAWVFISLAALEHLGFNTTPFAAVLGAAGLAIGLALQGSLSNFAAGVMIILMRHFGVGDTIEAAGQTGVVSDIQLFSSVLMNAEGVKIIVPNGAITGGTIKVLPPVKR